jgi:hypothetical protein
MEQILTDFLFKQLPVIVVLGCLCYFMYKYFTKVISDMQVAFSKTIEEKDKMIKDKDDEIKSLHRSVIEMTIRNNELTSRNNEVIGRLRDLIEKIVTSK